MLILVMMLTAFAVVREREIGTLEQIMVTPIRRWEFILGKTIPFFLVGCVDATLIALVGTFGSGCPSAETWGCWRSGWWHSSSRRWAWGCFFPPSPNQQQAMIASFFFTMPMITLSGFGTPIASMPPLLQKMSYANPLRHIMVILRSVYLKGSGFDVLWPRSPPLAHCLFLLTISVLRFHKSLE
jgi:ABC-2 type transport system permease protein